MSTYDARIYQSGQIKLCAAGRQTNLFPRCNGFERDELHAGLRYRTFRWPREHDNGIGIARMIDEGHGRGDADANRSERMRRERESICRELLWASASDTCQTEGARTRDMRSTRSAAEESPKAARSAGDDAPM